MCYWSIVFYCPRYQGTAADRSIRCYSYHRSRLQLLLYTHTLALTYTQVISPREEFSGKTIMTVMNQTVVKDAKSSVDTLHTYDDAIGLVSVLLWRDSDSEKCQRINTTQDHTTHKTLVEFQDLYHLHTQRRTYRHTQTQFIHHAHIPIHTGGRALDAQVVRG